MYGLFRTREIFTLPQFHFSEFDYLQRTYLRELANVVDFYNTRIYAVKTNHFLSNILYQLDVPLQYDLDRYVELANARAAYIAKSVQMTSEINRGKIFQGVFYGPGCDELIIYDDEYFNPYQAERHWEQLTPVKVLLHPKSDLGLVLPNGKYTATGEGLAVISVNVAMLALQYRCFLMKQQTKIQHGNDILGISHFIHMYVLPSMLYSQLDITLLNRLMNLYYGKPMGKALVKHSFTVTNYAHRMDTLLERVLESLTNRVPRFELVLNQMPTVVAATMREALQLPDLAPTRQLQWALVLSRLNVMAFLIDLAGEQSSAQNRAAINQIQRILVRMASENVFNAVLPDDMQYETTQLIDRIMTA